MRGVGRKLFLAALLVGIVAATGWTLSTGTLPPADFTFANGTEIKSVDPAIITGSPEGRVVDALFEGLTRWDPKDLHPVAGVAELPEISADGRTYTFHLRPEARWSDNTPVTAHDFVYSWRRFLAPDIAAEYAYQLWYVVNAKRYTQSEVTVGDKVEVEFAERPNAALPHARGKVVYGVLREKSGGEKDAHYKVEIDGKVRQFTTGKTVSGAERCEWVLLDFREVGVKALDDHTLRVQLENPTPYFVNLTGFYPLFPVNRKCVETYGDPEWTRTEHLVGDGPYRMKFRRLRDRIRLEKSDTYWDRDNVALNTIDVLAVDSATTALNLYLTGKADWIPTVPGTVAAKLMSEHRPDFDPKPILATYIFRVNVKGRKRGGEWPLANKRVRQALSRALDRREIVEAVTQSGEVPALSFVPPGIAGYTAAYAAPFDVDAARALLKEAGFEGGRGLTIEILYNDEETHTRIVELMQHQWKQNLGIDVRLAKQEWNSFLSSTRDLEYDLARGAWIGDYPDPNTFLDMFVTGGQNNQTGWGNAEYDRLVHDAAHEVDPKKRMETLRQAEAILMDELPIIPVYYYVSKNMVHGYVKGFYNTNQDVHPLTGISIDRAKQGHTVLGSAAR